MVRPAVFALLLTACPALALEIPAQFTGGWGLSAAACGQGEGAEGYLHITQTRMQFYESTGTLTAYETIDEPGLLFEFGFSGEGETWTEAIYLETRDAGATLIRIDMGPPRGIPIAYIACNLRKEPPG